LYRTLLRDSSLFALLLRFDEDVAAEVRLAGCMACGGVLHSARYPRKPRGGPEGLGAEHRRRPSFCCAVDGCRRRATPPSLRFLGRKVFFGLWVLLLHGAAGRADAAAAEPARGGLRGEPADASALAAVVARGGAAQPVLASTPRRLGVAGGAGVAAEFPAGRVLAPHDGERAGACGAAVAGAAGRRRGPVGAWKVRSAADPQKMRLAGPGRPS